jgi:hypothetical protein
LCKDKVAGDEEEFMVVCKTVALRKGREVATEEGGWCFSP